MNISAFIALAIASTIPVLATAMGGLFADRARATNIGMDGSMLIGALVALGVTDTSKNPWIGLAAGILAGAVFALLLAFSTYILGSDLIIGGIALNLVAIGLGLLATAVIFKQPGTYAPADLQTLPKVPLGPLAEIPVIGPAINNQSVLVWVTLALVVVAWFVMNRTRFGLWVRASGENADAARAVGIHPNRVRTATLFASGATAGLGGAFLTISSVGAFNSQVTNGAGFIALAAIIFGRATVLGTFGAAALFGTAVAIALQLQATAGLSPQLLQALPYVLTILVLAMYGIRQQRRKRYQASDTAYSPVITPN